MPPQPIPAKHTRYPVYLPPPPKTPTPAISKKRAIVPSKPLRSPSLATERTPLLSSSPSSSSTHSTHSHRHKPTRIPQIPPRHAEPAQPERRSSVASQRVSTISFQDGERPSAQRLSKPRSPSPPMPEKKKPFYRPRPLWLVPFAIIAALVRGMTLAPRVEVYTQLACYSVHPTPPSIPPISIPDHEPPTKRRRTESTAKVEWTPDSAISLYASLDPLGPHLFPAPQLQRVPRLRPSNTTLVFTDDAEADSNRDPRTLPSTHCLTSPLVQSHAARLQTLMTMTTGILSALSTSYWGRFSAKYGRTRVMAIATLGLLTTDLVFIVTSTPNLPWPLSYISYTPDTEGQGEGLWKKYRHYILLLGPIVEGTLGGWTTLQSATSAYLSDCTSTGSRAGVFARFTGVFYVGFSVGPIIGGWVVRNSARWAKMGVLEMETAKAPGKVQQSVTMVFWLAIACSLLNFLLVLFVFPESLDKAKNAATSSAASADDEIDEGYVVVGSSGDDNGKGKGRAFEYATPSTVHHPIFPIVEDVEGVGGGDGFVDVEELASPISPTSSGFLPPRASGSQLTSPPPPSSSSLRSSSPLSTPNNQTTPPPSLFATLLSPLLIFLPAPHLTPTRNLLHLHTSTDYSLSLLALALFVWMLSTGVYQIKYLYAGHTYGWTAEALSGYVSWMGAVRAVVLLGVVPGVVGWVKRGVEQEEVEDMEEGESEGKGKGNGAKKEPTRMQLGRSIAFDLKLARVSLFVDLMSNALIAVTPSPSFHSSAVAFFEALHPNALASSTPSSGASTLVSALKTTTGRPATITHAQSQAMFVAASSLSAFGGGLVPAVHSLALCIVQARTLPPVLKPFMRDVEEYGSVSRSSYHNDVFDGSKGKRSSFSSLPPSEQGGVLGGGGGADHHPPAAAPVDAGTLLSAFAVLQAISQTILAPMLFGVVYASTVQSHPKTVFVLSAGLLLGSLVLVCAGVRNPVREVGAVRRERRMRERVERAGVRRGVVANSVNATTSTPAMKANANAKAAPMPIVKRWERDMGRRGRSVVSKDLRGGAARSVSDGYAYGYGDESGSVSGSYAASSGMGARSHYGSLQAPSTRGVGYGSVGSGAGGQRGWLGVYGSLPAGKGEKRGLVSGGLRSTS